MQTWAIMLQNQPKIFVVQKVNWFGLGFIGYQPLLFNAKSSLYIYTEDIWFGLVRFYGISTIVGY